MVTIPQPAKWPFLLLHNCEVTTFGQETAELATLHQACACMEPQPESAFLVFSVQHRARTQRRPNCMELPSNKTLLKSLPGLLERLSGKIFRTSLVSLMDRQHAGLIFRSFPALHPCCRRFRANPNVGLPAQASRTKRSNSSNTCRWANKYFLKSDNEPRTHVCLFRQGNTDSFYCVIVFKFSPLHV